MSAAQREDRTALSWWFPKIEAAGLPVPKTIILDMPKAAHDAIWSAFDGIDPTNALSGFAAEVAAAGDELGWPCFLRTDHTSGKHGWDMNCHVPNVDAITERLYGVAEYSAMAGFAGLPFDRWAVRELLPTIPVGVCRGYGNMPICKEFRFFVDDGNVRCWHPYWPLHALEQGGAEYSGQFDFDGFCRPDDLAGLTSIAEAAGRAVGGAWSVDLLETERGWFLTDMAEAEKSFHWDGCPEAAR